MAAVKQGQVLPPKTSQSHLHQQRSAISPQPSQAFLHRLGQIQEDLRVLGVQPLDSMQTTVSTIECVAELITKVKQLKLTAASAQRKRQSSTEAQIRQVQLNEQQANESVAIKLQSNKLEVELTKAKSQLFAKDQEIQKVLTQARASITKLETKLVQQRHEIRKLSIDNDKLRQTLKAKLNIGKSGLSQLNPVMTQVRQEGDQFYEMVKDGFFEQIQAMNEELQSVQSFSLRLTKWIFTNFRVKLFKQMPLKDLDFKLDSIQVSLKEESECQLKPSDSEIPKEQEQATTQQRHSRVQSQTQPDFRVPHFGMQTSVVEPSENLRDESCDQQQLFKHIDKRPSAYKDMLSQLNYQVIGDDLQSRQCKQNNLFQQGAAQQAQQVNSTETKVKQKLLSNKRPSDIKPMGDGLLNTASQVKVQRKSTSRHSVRPFSQTPQSDFANSNNLSNQGKGTTFFFDD